MLKIWKNHNEKVLTVGLRVFCVLLAFICIFSTTPLIGYESDSKLLKDFNAFADSESTDDEMTVLFTHDTHDYLYPTSTIERGKKVEHGGAAKLVTLLKANRTKNTLYLDAGDFSMGTLYQAAYATKAYELRNLGIIGCSVTTLGNHEFDFGIEGIISMLRAAMNSGDKLPAIVQSNIDFSGELTQEQRELRDTLYEYGVQEYVIKEVGDYKVGIFGLMGYDGIECTQAEVSFKDYIEAAKETVERIKDEDADVIIALSHAGTNGDGITGEDIDLAAAVPDIDIIVSGHTHTVYDEPIYVGDTVIVSCGEYLKNLGKITFTAEDGKIYVKNYQLIPVDSSVEDYKGTVKRIESYKADIENTFLRDDGMTFDQVICHSDYDLIDLTTMYETHQEYNMGDIIADSYIYEAKKNGIDDIDVAIVGLGTIRGSLKQGDITVKDAFEICSLGVGSDGSAGHPIVAAYLTGKELKLVTELDASLGPVVSSIKMSYSGMEYSFNTKRLLLDRVTSVYLVREDGTREKIENDKLYKVAANMYGLNMLGMLNGLTKGILSITPKDKDGNPIENFYDYALINTNGNEIKEWICLKDFLMSFEAGESGIPELPLAYEHGMGRKVKTEEGGLAVISHPGTATKIMPLIILGAVVLISLIILVIALIVKMIKRKKRKKNRLFY